MHTMNILLVGTTLAVAESLVFSNGALAKATSTKDVTPPAL